jgi:hypothetical protein
VPTPLTSSRDSRILLCSILGLQVLMGYYLVYISVRVSHAHFGDFPTFYNAGWSVRSHTDPYAPGDDRVLDVSLNADASPKAVKGVVSEIERMGGQAYFSAEKHNAVVAIEGGGKLDKERISSLAGVEKVTPDGMSYVYPPLFAVLCKPLTFLRATGGAMVFLFINVACVLASLLIGSRAMMRRLGVPLATPAIFAAALLAGILAENDLRGELQAMETDVLIMLMFTLALHWLDDKPLRSGAALAFAMNIKYLTILALPYLLLRRRWKAAGGMVVWTVGFALLPALVLGWKENLRYLHTALGGLLGWVGKSTTAGATAHVHGIADGLSVSVTSAFARALKMHQLPQSYSLPIAAALGLLLLAGAWLLYRRNHFPMWRWPDAIAQQSQPFRGLVALEWAALIIVTLAFSPDTNTRHLSMVALVYTCAAPMLLVRREQVPWWPLFLGTLIAFVGLIMPVKALVSLSVLRFYFKWSFCSWSLLVMYALLLWTGLRYITRPGHLR